MKELRKSNNLCICILYLLIYIFFFFLIWCSPYTRDDYDFLSLRFNTVSEFFSYILHYGNGRLLGNICGIFLIHFPGLSFAIRAFILTSILFLTPYIWGYKNINAFILSFVLFVLADPILFGEVYLWSSAFYNYLPPILLTQLSLYLIRSYSLFDRSKPLICSILLILGLCSQLFIEPSTITNLIMSASLFVYSIAFKKKDLILPSSFWFLGTTIGAALMFSIPMLFYIEGNPAEKYRSYNLQSILSLVISCCKNALKIGYYFSGMNSIPICLGAVSTIYMTRNIGNTKANYVMLKTSVIICCILFINSLLSTNIWGGELAILQHIITFVIVLIQVCLWFIASLKLSLPHGRYTISFLIILSLISLAPLLVVSPIPERTVFQAYFWMNTAAMICILEQLKTVSASVFSKYKKILATVAFSIVFILFSTFISVKYMVNTRDQYILSELEKGSSEIVVFRIPYKYTSLDSTWSYDMYFFRENKKDTVFQAIDYTQWTNDYLPGK